jgi:hypothetical protein
VINGEPRLHALDHRPKSKHPLNVQAIRFSRAAVPPAGLFGAHGRLQPPMLDEGFDHIHLP